MSSMHFKLINPLTASPNVANGIIFFSTFAQSIAQISTTDFQTAEKINEFLKEEVVFERYVFPTGEFPTIKWKNEHKVVQLVGDVRLNVHFYDAGRNEIKRAEKTGRYGAVVRGIVNGYEIKRYTTLFCIQGDVNNWIDSSINNIRSNSKHRAQIHLMNIENIVAELHTKMQQYNITQDPLAAVYLSALSESNSNSKLPFNPRYIDRQWWLDFKLKSEIKRIPLQVPKENGKVSLSTVLRNGVPSLEGFNRNDLDSINAVCLEWLNSAQEPFSILVARNGNIIYHQAYGKLESGGSMSISTPRWMASITKLLTGILMMHFIEAGTISLDDPVKKYLPEFTVNTVSDITVRQLFNHTSGLIWDEDWTSEYNESLENMCGSIIPYINPGKRFSYNRVGYALAGKILERITGRIIPYLFYDKLITPLDLKNTTIENTYGATYATSYDLAVIGQMLLNGGSYNGYTMFSPMNLKEMLPVRLDRLGVDSDRSWGIGTRWFKEYGLSDSTFGHSAASGSIIRIDIHNRLIIVCARNTMGSTEEVYNQFVKKLVNAITNPINRSK